MKIPLWAVACAILLTGCATVSSADFEVAAAVCEDQSVISRGAENGLVLLVAPTSNFTTPGQATEAILSEAREALNGDTEIQALVSSGDTSLVYAAKVDLSAEFVAGNANKIASRSLAAAVNSARCHQELGYMQPELDLLKGLRLAGSALQAYPGSKHLVIVSNGLQTTGDLKLQDNFEASAAELVDSLNDEGAIPNLAGVTISFFGLGQTSGEQPSFSTKSLNHLEEIWAGIINAGGGQVTFSGLVALGEGNADAPMVSVVAPLRMSPIVAKCQSTLTDENLTFVANSAEFVNQTLAEATLLELRSQLVSQNCSGTVTVTGFTTNFGDEVAQKSLATARAEAVASGLQESLSELPFEIVGFGYDGDGDLDPRNRRVEVKVD